MQSLICERMRMWVRGSELFTCQRVHKAWSSAKCFRFPCASFFWLQKKTKTTKKDTYIFCTHMREMTATKHTWERARTHINYSTHLQLRGASGPPLLTHTHILPSIRLFQVQDVHLLLKSPAIQASNVRIAGSQISGCSPVKWKLLQPAILRLCMETLEAMKVRCHAFTHAYVFKRACCYNSWLLIPPKRP